MPKTEHLKATQFKPGQSGNPKGRAVLPIKGVLREVTKEVLGRVIEEALAGNIDNIFKISQSPEVSAMEAILAKCLFEAYKKGDYTTYEKIIERIVGKIPVVLEVNARHMVKVLTPEERKSVIQEFEESL